MVFEAKAQPALLVLVFAAVCVMMVQHMYMGKWRRAFAEDRNEKSARFFRFMNEVPTVLMIVVVIMVIVQPG